MKNKSSLYIQYLLLFTLIAIVPVITTCSALLLSNHALKAEVTQSNLASLELVQQSMDSKYLELTNIQSVIEQNPALTKSALLNSPVQAISEINKISRSYSTLSDILLYVRNADLVFSSGGAFSLNDIQYQNFATDIKNHGYDISSFLNELQNVSSPQFWPRNCIENFPKDIYLFSPIFNTGFKYEATNSSRIAILQISRETINDLFSASQTNSGESILWFDSEKQLISYYSSSASLDTIKKICDHVGSVQELLSVDSISIDGSKYLLFASQSSKTGLIYVRFLPEAVALQTLNRTETTSYSILAVALIISVFLVYVGMKKSYFPLKSLADWIKEKKPGPKDYDNELIIVKNAFEETLQQNTSMSELISDSRYGLIDHFLQDLICGKFDSPGSFNKACKKLSISFDKEYFTVACLLFSTGSSEYNTKDFEFILSIIKGLLPDSINLHVKDLLFSGKLIFVVNCSGDDLTTLKDLLFRIKREISIQTDCQNSMGTGASYSSFEYVGKSYLEAINALDYRMIYGNESIITPEMCRVNNSELEYPTEEISKLYSSIISKDMDSAYAVVKKLREYVKSPHCTLHLAKYICYDSFASLKKCPAFISVSYVEKLSGNLDITKLTDFDNVDEFFSVFLHVLETIINSTHSENPRNIMAERIMKYIDENCFSYDFQISSIAEHFSLSQPSVRKVFSEYTGIGINDYVTNVKIDRAMTLLADSDKTLQQIVEEIGNTDTSAFIRLFKKRTGMTPGQYRKSIGTIQNNRK